MAEPVGNEPRRVRPMLGEFISNGWTGGVLEEGPGMIIMGVLLGAFAGLLFGLIAMHVARFLSFSLGRNFSGATWALISMALGAAVFGIITATDKD